MKEENLSSCVYELQQNHGPSSFKAVPGVPGQHSSNGSMGRALQGGWCLGSGMGPAAATLHPAQSCKCSPGMLLFGNRSLAELPVKF